MRAGRLVAMLRLLQARGRMTARELAEELEVSQRTVFRDIEALSGGGVPVYAVRGAQGGFELLAGAARDLPVPEAAGALPSGTRRARVRLTPMGRRMVTVLGRPTGVRIRHGAPPVAGREGWIEASVLIGSVDSAVSDMLALGPEVEVVSPAELRARLADAGRRITELHAGPACVA